MQTKDLYVFTDKVAILTDTLIACRIRPIRKEYVVYHPGVLQSYMKQIRYTGFQNAAIGWVIDFSCVCVIPPVGLCSLEAGLRCITAIVPIGST